MRHGPPLTLPRRKHSEQGPLAKACPAEVALLTAAQGLGLHSSQAKERPRSGGLEYSCPTSLAHVGES